STAATCTSPRPCGMPASTISRSGAFEIGSQDRQGRRVLMTDKMTVKRGAASTAATVASALLLAACTGHKKDVTQPAARVDGTEITVHQINYRLQRERGLRPDPQEKGGAKGLAQVD